MHTIDVEHTVHTPHTAECYCARTKIVTTVISASTSPGFTSNEPHSPDVDAVRRELLRTIVGPAVVRELK